MTMKTRMMKTPPRPITFSLCALSVALLSACAGTQESPVVQHESNPFAESPILYSQSSEEGMDSTNNNSEPLIQPATPSEDASTTTYFDEEDPGSDFIYSGDDDNKSEESAITLTSSPESATDNPETKDSDMTVLIIDDMAALQHHISAQQAVNDAHYDTLETSLNETKAEENTSLTESDNQHEPDKRIFHFGFNQSELTDEDIRLLESHAEYLSQNPEMVLKIHGHTDKRGNAKYNLKLSEQRASQVRKLLIQMGVIPERIKVVGWGGDYPLTAEQNHAENRRVELQYETVHFAAN